MARVASNLNNFCSGRGCCAAGQLYRIFGVGESATTDAGNHILERMLLLRNVQGAKESFGVGW